MSEPLPSDRRAEERHPCSAPGYLHTEETGPLESFWWRCQVRDVSVNGCRLTMQRCLKPGSSLTIDLSMPGSPTSYVLPARVAHVTAEGPRSFGLGCAFLRPLTASELEAVRSVAETHKGVWAQPTAKDLLEE